MQRFLQFTSTHALARTLRTKDPYGSTVRITHWLARSFWLDFSAKIAEDQIWGYDKDGTHMITSKPVEITESPRK